MPELPEVETICRRLNECVTGKTLARVIVSREKSFQGNPTSLVGMSISQISRRSKILQLDLEQELHLLIHLKMTGQLIFVDGVERVGGGHPTPDFIQDLPTKHTRVEFQFADGTTLFFNDQRIFGWCKVVTTADLATEYQGLAQDIVDPLFPVSLFIERVSRRSQAIKQVIMDNAVVAGVGNIYACDALNLAQLDPRRPANSLTEVEVTRLFSAMQTVIQLGITHGGATISSYVTAEGLTGSYQKIRRVYKREGEPCPNCGSLITKIKLGGRGTFFCSNCQL